MKPLMIALLLASPLSAAAQQVHLFAPNRFDHLLAGSHIRIAASGSYGGNSVDLLAITSAARIINDFVPTDLLLVGGLVPGVDEVDFGARGQAGVHTAIGAGAWRMSASVEAGSYAALRVPADAANLLREGNIVANNAIDTRNMFASGLVTREVGLAIARRQLLGSVTLEFGAAARHIAPVMFATARIEPLYDGPAFVIDNGNISARVDVMHANGRADGGGFALELHAGIAMRGMRASITVSDVGRVDVDAETRHRAVDVQHVDIEQLLEHIDHTVATASSELRTLALPYRVDARVSTALSDQFSGGLFFRQQSAGDVGVGDSALGAALGWTPGDVLYLRAGLARMDHERWAMMAGAGLELGRVYLDVALDTDDPPTLERARSIGISTSLGFRF